MSVPQERPGDEPGGGEVVSRAVRLRGMKWDVVTDVVRLGDGTTVRRDVVVHPGAVGVVALDDVGRVLLQQQYRHPVAARLWELPAGLLDLPGEPALAAAQRELAEEAHLEADQWHVLLDLFTSPGMSGEAVRIYLARGLRHVPEHARHERSEEERDMPAWWLPLDDAVAHAHQGRLHNALAVAGLFAAQSARDSGWSLLRPADSPWPERDDRYHAGADEVPPGPGAGSSDAGSPTEADR